MTCQRVIIINKGKVVAEDTPDNLTARLSGSERLVMEVEGPADAVKQALQAVPGVQSLSVDRANGDGRIQLTIESGAGSDLRKELARTVVNNGWGLLELRPVEMSLEDVFLHLVTEEEEVAN